MAEAKTKPTEASVIDFLNSVEDERKRKDSFTILEIMKEISGFEPKMWGTSIIGFGNYHYKYESGHEGDAPLVGFSPRKQNISLYLMSGIEGFKEVDQIGKIKVGKGCIYIKKLEDINVNVLKNLLRECILYLNQKYN